MSIFDFVEDVTELTVETIVRLPEVPIKIVKGTITGIEKGIEKIEDAF